MGNTVQYIISKQMLWVLAMATLATGCTRSTPQAAEPERGPESTPHISALAEQSQGGNQSVTLAADENSLCWQGSWNDADWRNDWQVRSEKSWGFENLEIVTDDDSSTAGFLRVYYPAGSASPAASRREGVALGGAQFYADLNLPPQDHLRLRYRVRFSHNFDFVKGGKLPGLFGGEGASGGIVPDGTDGFSTRLMWRQDGDGEVYAYLPTSERYGTSIGRGSWRFHANEWFTVEQEVRLNHPGETDGQIRLWVNGTLVINEQRITFRSIDALNIDGIFFSTFFGGGDSSWATPQDVYADFADFRVNAPTC